MKCEVRGVKRALRSVKKVFAWRCIAPGPRAGHVLGQHNIRANRFAQTMHARAWLAHGACKFYKCEGSYNITLRQLPPRLVQVLLVERVLMSVQHAILVFPQLPLLIQAHETKQWPLFSRNIFYIGIRKNTCINIFLAVN